MPDVTNGALTNVLTGMDKSINTDMILIGLQKAFDTLGHKILLEKMTCIGFKTK